MKFGILKTKIETLLSESYKKDTFRTEIKNFRKLVLENKKIGRLFQLYNELNSNKGLDDYTSTEYINECIKIYENNINKITRKELDLLENWTKDVKVKNEYDNIDNLFSNDITLLEKKILSRKIIKESLQRKPNQKKAEIVKLPLSTMINVANKTITNYIENLSESEKEELKNLLTISEEELKGSFNLVKNEVLEKLKSIQESTSDSEIKTKINETIQKVSTEECDRASFLKLKNLKENL